MVLKKIAAASLAMMMIAGIGSMAASAAELETGKTSVQIKTVAFYKVSSTKIKLAWSDTKDAQVKTYYLQKYDESAGKWKNIATRNSDGLAGNAKYAYTDVLSSSAPQQYRYRVCVKVSDENRYKAVNGTTQYASNIKVCIDPGHYQTENPGTSGYTEAQAMLSVGTSLKTYLKKQGIDSYMTRTDEDITLGGKYNKDDGGQLEARGRAAKANNCDLFLSLHTNANGENANGVDTLHQPNALNKTVVFVNKVAYNQSGRTVLKMANRMGYNVTMKNKELGIPTCNWLNSSTPTTYRINGHVNDAFTTYNDATRKKGKLVLRLLSEGDDYYAVLRAAAYDGVPGILIEHSYHTVPAFCKAFMKDSNVAKHYALCDARAIGAAYGFKVLKNI